MRWVTSRGGPFMIVAAEVAPLWGGLGDDYERACGVTESLETLEIGGRDAVVLGDEPWDAAVDPLGRPGLVHWDYAPDEETFLEVMKNEDTSLRLEAECRGVFPRGVYLMFEAVMTRSEAKSEASVLELQLRHDAGICRLYSFGDVGREVKGYVTMFECVAPGERTW